METRDRLIVYIIVLRTIYTVSSLQSDVKILGHSGGGQVPGMSLIKLPLGYCLFGPYVVTGSLLEQQRTARSAGTGQPPAPRERGQLAMPYRPLGQILA